MLKNIQTLFSDKQDKIMAFLKDKDPDLKTDQGLLDLFAFYNAA